jgi:PAS domain S-box-containing protein
LPVEDLLENLEGESSIDFKGMRMSVRLLPDYKSRDTTYRSRYALLNDHILVISTNGKPSPYDIKSAIDQQITFLKQNGIVSIDLIWNVKSLNQPSIRIRKAMIDGNKRLSPFLKSRYLIVPPKYKTLIRIFRFIYQPKVEHLFFVESVDDALCALTTGCESATGQEVSFKLKWPAKADLLKKSKEELADMIVDYSKKHEQSTNKILQALGHISWGGRFNKVEIVADENDLHFEMVNAFSLLQQDVEEIIREYKELNQNLELKVAERIVDFIDKESNLRSILDNSDRMTWLMNTRFELIDFNTAFINEIKRRYQINPKINDNVLDFISNERERGVWQERFGAAMEGRAGIYLDQDMIDGEERVYEIKTFPIQEIGKIKGVSVFIEDITQLKRSQLKLIEKNRDLQKVNSELDSFVYRVSHDLRAPLTSILGLISLMRIETSQEKVGEYIGLQEKSILKLDLFIKEIINLSRNSRLGITVSEIDFEDLVNEIYESQHYSSSSDNIQRLVEVEDGIHFFTDRQRLSIILNNLISNGLKYVNPNEANPFVKVKVSSLEEKCLIEVIDNGIGISETYLPKIFEMFFRATQEFSGSGLGLYIVKETVEKLKGKITVKSKMRQGSVFKVVLPNLKERFDAAPKLEE